MSNARNEMEKILKAAGRMADTAVQTTVTVVDKGRARVEQYALEHRLAKAERRLGSLFYTMHKAGDINEKLLARYVEDVDKILEELALYDSGYAPAAASAQVRDVPPAVPTPVKAAPKAPTKKAAAKKPAAKKTAAKKPAVKKPAKKKATETVPPAEAKEDAMFRSGGNEKPPAPQDDAADKNK